ncbi:MgtC/SapB family protein [Neobacillus ginsengisoli]|uniref:Mg2+ transporter-C (MgtC) family protein n=1 Tax=Neobacillus ginsengisoli TaxID=904295 RepID=A0ABT9XXV0_9BACI|nr:MgtC/SapB family protein [Neobacillus ginsengisoli]MDQ0200306.1 putative Mg2+ transporter-C (MgtC) family protein [Neobacillus ginsengisoli]
MVNDINTELHYLPIIILRLFLAFIAGSVIGWERETSADLPVDHHGSMYRMFALVCIGACIFTVVGEFGFSKPLTAPDRVAANVVTGVGFLGAGLILKDKIGEIHGLPTAVGIWVSASIGVMIGAGNYISGLIGALFVYFVMDMPHRFPRLFQKRKIKD